MQTENQENTKIARVRNTGSGSRFGKFDPDSVLRDLLHQWWMIVLSALAGALLLGALAIYRYTPTYTSTTIFAIGTTGYTYSSSRIYENYTQASTTTSQFSQVVSSSILRRQVCEKLGISSLNASISVSTVSATNLMVLTVTAGSPRQAYVISCAVKEEAVELMDYFLDGVTLMEIQKTNVPDSETSPLDLFHSMFYGFLIGAGGMLALLILLSCTRGTVKNPNDAAALVDARLLGTIGYEKKGAKRKIVEIRKNGGNRINTGTGKDGGNRIKIETGKDSKNGKNETGGFLGNGKEKRESAKKESLLISNPMRSFSYVEACRMLGSNMQIALDQMGAKALMVTSTAENEGKTTVAANIALAISQQGRKVLLMDLDFRKPAIYKVFGQPDLEDRDFCESLVKGTNIKFSHAAGNPNLLLLLSKKTISGSWNRERFALIGKTIEYMKNRVDYIIMDTPPLELVSDGEEFAAFSDACVMVVREDMVYAAAINDAIDSLNAAGTDVIGCVLNASRTGIFSRIMQSGHYGAGGYGYYSHYGKA